MATPSSGFNPGLLAKQRREARREAQMRKVGAMNQAKAETECGMGNTGPAKKVGSRKWELPNLAA